MSSLLYHLTYLNMSNFFLTKKYFQLLLLFSNKFFRIKKKPQPLVLHHFHYIKKHQKIKISFLPIHKTRFRERDIVEFDTQHPYIYNIHIAKGGDGKITHTHTYTHRQDKGECKSEFVFFSFFYC